MKKFNHYLVYDDAHRTDRDGEHKIYRFRNNYGASVVRFLISGAALNIGSYGAHQGKWELAVIKFRNPVGELDYTLGLATESEMDYILVYDTPVTDDVLGYLTEEEVGKVLQQIKNLPNEEQENR